jgi:hypothetical protein
MTSDGTRALLWLLLLATLLVAAVLGAFFAWGFSEALPPGTIVEIDGERFALHDLAPRTAGQWLLWTLGVLVAALAIVLVVPLAALLALAVPAAVGGVTIGLTLLVLGLMIWPLVLLGRWLGRRPHRTTIAT